MTDFLGEDERIVLQSKARVYKSTKTGAGQLHLTNTRIAFVYGASKVKSISLTRIVDYRVSAKNVKDCLLRLQFKGAKQKVAQAIFEFIGEKPDADKDRWKSILKMQLSAHSDTVQDVKDVSTVVTAPTEDKIQRTVQNRAAVLARDKELHRLYEVCLQHAMK